MHFTHLKLLMCTNPKAYAYPSAIFAVCIALFSVGEDNDFIGEDGCGGEAWTCVDWRRRLRQHHYTVTNAISEAGE